MAAAIAGLTADAYDAAVELARSVSAIRGYEDIKSEAIERWRSDTAALRPAPPAPPRTARHDPQPAAEASRRVGRPLLPLWARFPSCGDRFRAQSAVRRSGGGGDGPGGSGFRLWVREPSREQRIAHPKVGASGVAAGREARG